MAAINSIITRIKDLVGDEVTSIEGYKDLINSGFNHAADLIPSDSELWRSAFIESSTDKSTLDASDAKVILVTRQDNSGVDRVAKEVTLDYLKRGQSDSTSIYYNAGNYRNPIYSFEPNGDMVIKPDGGTIAIYRYTYLTSTDVTDLTHGETFDFPEQALFLGILKACSYLLQAKISEAVQEEEDNELFALTQGQIATIDKITQEELQRLGLPFQLVGDGNDIK
tara:strand:+ start:76 stop:747 length:672 start_codon:yes stop_codon:yes gene_type:complete